MRRASPPRRSAGPRGPHDPRAQLPDELHERAELLRVDRVALVDVQLLGGSKAVVVVLGAAVVVSKECVKAFERRGLFFGTEPAVPLQTAGREAMAA